MNYLNSLRAVALAGVVFATSANGFAKDHHDHHSDHGSSYGHSHYGHSYVGPHFGYRPYYYSRPSVSFGFYSAPAYSSDYYYDSYPTRTYYRTVPRASYSYSDDLAVDVQRALARRGYYRGGIDGDVGPGTRAAIRSYQYNRGLTVTGRIDSSLLRSLGLG